MSLSCFFKRKMAVCLSILIIIVSLSGCSFSKKKAADSEYKKNPSHDATADIELTMEDVRDKFTEDVSGEEALCKEAEDNDSHRIDLELIKQYPELPTGCESVALTMVLRYYGFDISKTEIAKNYLIYSNSGNYVTGFVGNPFYSTGSGCYAPGIADTANAFLKAQGSKLNAVNVTGAPLEELYGYVNKDIPVIIWVTSDYDTLYSDTSRTGNKKEYNGIVYDWTYEEHCVVLAGYNKASQSVTLYDPIKGIVSIDEALLNKIYTYMYSMAVIIK